LPGGWRNRYPDDSTHLASARGDADGAEDGARREHRHHVALVDRRAKREPARGTCAYECEPKGTGGGICKYRRAWLRGQASVTDETLQNICSPLLISKPLLVRVLDDRAFRDRPLDASTRTHTHTHTPPTTSRHIRAADRATAPRWPSPPRSAARASYRICGETVKKNTTSIQLPIRYKNKNKLTSTFAPNESSFCAVTVPNSKGKMSSLSPCTSSMGVLAATCGSAIIGAGYMSRMGRYELSAKTPPRFAPVNKTRRQCHSNCPYASYKMNVPFPNPCSAAVSATAPPWLNPPMTIFSGGIPSEAMSSWTMPVTNCADWRIRGWSSTNVSTVSVNRSISYHCDRKNTTTSF